MSGNNVQDPVVLFTQFRLKNPNGEGYATVNYTIRDADDDAAVARLNNVITAFLGGSVVGGTWEHVNEPKPVGGYGGGGKGGGGNRPSHKSADIPNNRFVGHHLAWLRIPKIDKQTGAQAVAQDGSPIFHNKVRVYDETHTLYAEEFGPDWDNSLSNQRGIKPTFDPANWKSFVPQKGIALEIRPEDCKPYPSNLQVEVVVERGDYGYKVVNYEVSRVNGK